MKVILTGGLGNQIFQLNAALDLYPGEITLITNIGRPRVDAEGKAEILSLTLPQRVRISAPRIPFPAIATRIFGLNLRAHFAPGPIEKHFLGIYRKLSSIIFSILLKEISIVRSSTDVGFSEIKKITKYDLLIGYFQSHRYLSDKSRAELGDLIPTHPSQEYLKKLDQLENLSILTIHIRLGDYFSEPGIGVLGRSYFEKAIKSLDLTDIDLALVFTDSPERVNDYLPKDLDFEIEIASNDLSSSETLKLMSLGTQFVISNSTFSWWAAALSTSIGKVVVAPTPWFEKQTSPKELISPNWKLVER